MLKRDERVMGFGHRQFSRGEGDPRTSFIKQWALKLGVKEDDQRMFKIADTIGPTMLKKKSTLKCRFSYRTCLSLYRSPLLFS
ncbi:MAG: citrate/2-methylcitrate synthase [Parachlamydiaceae bacterium]